MKFLVTGGAGFIGWHLCRALLLRGDQVAVLDNLDPSYDPSEKLKNLSDLHALAQPGQLDIVQGDIRDAALYPQLLSGADGVFHLAALAGVRASALSPSRYMDVNVRGTIFLLSAMGQCGVKSAVYASSSSIYGDNPIPFCEQMPGDPLSPYGRTKLSAELLCAAHSHAWEAGIACARLFSVYGPRQRPDLALRRFATALMRWDPVELYGNCTRDYTDVEDTVQGLLLCMEWAQTHKTCEAFNIAAGRSVSTEQVLSLLEKELDAAPRKLRLPRQPLDAEHTLADLTKARTILGYEPKISFEDGVRRFLRWMTAADQD